MYVCGCGRDGSRSIDFLNEPLLFRSLVLLLKIGLTNLSNLEFPFHVLDHAEFSYHGPEILDLLESLLFVSVLNIVEPKLGVFPRYLALNFLSL